MKEDKGHQERPISRVANKNWRDNYDNIFKKKPTTALPEEATPKNEHAIKNL